MLSTLTPPTVHCCQGQLNYVDPLRLNLMVYVRTYIHRYNLVITIRRVGLPLPAVHSHLLLKTVTVSNIHFVPRLPVDASSESAGGSAGSKGEPDNKSEAEGVQMVADSSEGAREGDGRDNEATPGGDEAGQHAVGGTETVERDQERPLSSAQVVLEGVGSDPATPVEDSKTTEKDVSNGATAVEVQAELVAFCNVGEEGGEGESEGSEQYQGGEAMSKGDVAAEDGHAGENLEEKGLNTSSKSEEETGL